jgi:predicted small secreted protein
LIDTPAAPANVIEAKFLLLFSAVSINVATCATRQGAGHNLDWSGT